MIDQNEERCNREHANEESIGERLGHGMEQDFMEEGGLDVGC